VTLKGEIMNSNVSKRESNRQRWCERIKAWQQSGQSQSDFCEQNDLGLPSFQRWRRIFEEEKQTDPAPITFLPVNVKETSSSNLALMVSNDLRIEIPTGFDPNTLRQLIQVLRAS
jgi:hypothetical protein